MQSLVKNSSGKSNPRKQNFSRQPELRRISVSEYQRMGNTGILNHDEKTELLEGVIYKMSPISNKHASVVIKFNQLLIKKLDGKALVSIQNPCKLDDYNEPEPDILLLKNRSDFYEARHPQPKDVLLAIEVAHTSYKIDKEKKLPLYAQFGINEVWIINLNDDFIEVFRSPEKNKYKDEKIYTHGQSVSSIAFPEIKIRANEILLTTNRPSI